MKELSIECANFASRCKHILAFAFVCSLLNNHNNFESPVKLRNWRQSEINLNHYKSLLSWYETLPQAILKHNP